MQIHGTQVFPLDATSFPPARTRGSYLGTVTLLSLSRCLEHHAGSAYTHSQVEHSGVVVQLAPRIGGHVKHYSWLYSHAQVSPADYAGCVLLCYCLVVQSSFRGHLV